VKALGIKPQKIHFSAPVSQQRYVTPVVKAFIDLREGHDFNGIQIAETLKLLLKKFASSSAV